ncbi:hypothetical protein BT69DRAFT_1260965 [Atractiella rhizophila]|nr:hypothetical protein BT69DRAFT_1260965 [Atractiella rhizophila]
MRLPCSALLFRAHYHAYLSTRSYATSKLKTKTKVKWDDLPSSWSGPNPPFASADAPAGWVDENVPASAPVLLEGQGWGTKEPPPLEELILDNLKRFKGALLLTRVGKFYESYFQPQAGLISKLLNLKLTARRSRTNRDRDNGGAGFTSTPFCGFPYPSLQRHLRTLVLGHGYHVAICEEFPLWSRRHGVWVKSNIARRVTRVVTPGTWTEGGGENRWLVAVSSSSSSQPFERATKERKGKLRGGMNIACIDVGTGDFWEMKDVGGQDEVVEELVRIGAKEVVLDPASKRRAGGGEWVERLERIGAVEGWQVSFANPQPMDEGSQAEGEGEVLDEEGDATSLLMRYVNQTMLDVSPALNDHLSLPVERSRRNVMYLDSSVLNSLEIRESMGGTSTTTRGSLMSAIRRTVTDGGKRLLRDRLCYPSTDLEEITKRHSLVLAFFRSRSLREDLRDRLRSISDLPHLLQDLLLRQSSHKTFLDLKNSLIISNEVRTLLLDAISRSTSKPKDDMLALRRNVMLMQEHNELIAAIEGAVDDAAVVVEDEKEGVEGEEMEEGEGLNEAEGEEESSVALENLTDGKEEEKERGKDNWLINPNYNETFSNLHAQIRKLNEEARSLESNLRVTLNSPDLLLTTHPKLGPIVRVYMKRKGHDLLDKVTGLWNAVLVQNNKSLKVYNYEAWTVLASKLFELKQRIRSLEQSTFVHLKDQILSHHNSIRTNANIIHELDVAAGFAELAVEHQFVKPIMNNGTDLKLIGLRHPVVEMGLQSLGRSYTPSDATFSSQRNLQVITGPNMSGKSSFLRAVALSVLVAQAGSFVPAEEATIGIVDKIFTRVGARDEIWRDRSTFMIEMMETGEILKKAGERSLVVMDEVGRGSSTKDGIAISFAVVDHLLHRNKSKTLFATHHHELADMFHPSHASISFRCTGISENEDGSFSYTHELKDGVCRDSHGIRVAELAGLPPHATSTARFIAHGMGWRRKRPPGQFRKTTLDAVTRLSRLGWGEGKSS